MWVNGHSARRPWPSVPTSSSSGVSTSLKVSWNWRAPSRPAHRQLDALDARRVGVHEHGRELGRRALLARASDRTRARALRGRSPR